MSDDNDLNIFQQKARDWANEVVDLYNTPVMPQYAQDKQDMLNRAKWIKDKVELVLGKTETLAPLDTINLGVLPFIIGGVALASIAGLMYKWHLDYQTLIENHQHTAALISAGVPAEKAAGLTEESNAPSWMVEAKKIILPVVGLGALYLILTHK